MPYSRWTPRCCCSACAPVPESQCLYFGGFNYNQLYHIFNTDYRGTGYTTKRFPHWEWNDDLENVDYNYTCSNKKSFELYPVSLPDYNRSYYLSPETQDYTKGKIFKKTTDDGYNVIPQYIEEGLPSNLSLYIEEILEKAEIAVNTVDTYTTGNYNNLVTHHRYLPKGTIYLLYVGFRFYHNLCEPGQSLSRLQSSFAILKPLDIETGKPQQTIYETDDINAINIVLLVKTYKKSDNTIGFINPMCDNDICTPWDNNLSLWRPTNCIFSFQELTSALKTSILNYTGTIGDYIVFVIHGGIKSHGYSSASIVQPDVFGINIDFTGGYFPITGNNTTLEERLNDFVDIGNYIEVFNGPSPQEVHYFYKNTSSYDFNVPIIGVTETSRTFNNYIQSYKYYFEGTVSFEIQAGIPSQTDILNGLNPNFGQDLWNNAVLIDFEASHNLRSIPNSISNIVPPGIRNWNRTIQNCGSKYWSMGSGYPENYTYTIKFILSSNANPGPGPAGNGDPVPDTNEVNAFLSDIMDEVILQSNQYISIHGMEVLLYKDRVTEALPCVN